LLHFTRLAICEDDMSNPAMMSAKALRFDRAIGWRWIGLAAREVLLALHRSRRQMARRIVRDRRDLRDVGGPRGTK
jgi:hypothetical protein